MHNVSAVSPLLYWKVEATSSPTPWHSVAASVNDETEPRKGSNDTYDVSIYTYTCTPSLLSLYEFYMHAHHLCFIDTLFPRVMGTENFHFSA